MSLKGTKSRNFKPVGIFKNCKHRGQQVSIGIQEAQRLYTYWGYEVYVPNNPDKGGDDDFLAVRYPECLFVSGKTTTQYTKSKNPKPLFNLRTHRISYVNGHANQDGQCYGEVKIPTKYDELICIAENGTWCRWTRDQLKDVKSGCTFGCKGGQVGTIRSDEPLLKFVK